LKAAGNVVSFSELAGVQISKGRTPKVGKVTAGVADGDLDDIQHHQEGSDPPELDAADKHQPDAHVRNMGGNPHQHRHYGSRGAQQIGFPSSGEGGEEIIAQHEDQGAGDGSQKVEVEQFLRRKIIQEIDSGVVQDQHI